MKNLFSQKLIELAKSCPYPLYAVGGRVRDFLAGLETSKPDTDICAPADAEDFVERAKLSGYRIDAVYKNTGTVKLSCGEEEYEFTSFRSDEYIRGEHRPVKTFFTDDISLDAKRRDFKCNAVYYDICGGQFKDPLGGIADIKAKILTTVDKPEKVFGEDGLRLMRLARISAETGFAPTGECLAGAKANAELIADISAERVWAELDRILHADLRYGREYAPFNGLLVLKNTGVLKVILPELALGENMGQRKDIHDYDVLEHSLRCVLYADKSIRLSALLHDVGKPYCMLRDGNFYAHDREGARIVQDICTRLKVPKKLAERCAKLTELHMYDLRGDAGVNKVRKFIIKNFEYFDELMLLKQADFSACKDNTSVAPSVVKMTGILNKMKKEGLPLTLKDLAVKGNDLIDDGCPANLVGKTLQSLLLDCAVGQVKNEKAKLLARARKVGYFSI
ncbi:MAG: CCA tRNA nucleotidyltransferase [Clostridia bacterium]|nr:CCA tRNA nucleotidyltransferase [Clostridia bacterium]